MSSWTGDTSLCDFYIMTLAAIALGIYYSNLNSNSIAKVYQTAAVLLTICKEILNLDFYSYRVAGVSKYTKRQLKNRWLCKVLFTHRYTWWNFCLLLSHLVNSCLRRVCLQDEKVVNENFFMCNGGWIRL